MGVKTWQAEINVKIGIAALVLTQQSKNAKPYTREDGSN